MLQGQITTNTAGDLTRETGRSRAYKFNKRKRKDPEPEKVPKDLTPIGELIDGSAFAPKSTSSSVDLASYTCCNSKCNEEWPEDALERTRRALPRYGKGTQTARKVYVRSSFTLEDRQLHIRDGMNATPVCWRFYKALMGVSCNLLRSAGSVGPVHM